MCLLWHLQAATAKFFDVQIKLQTNFSVHTDQCVSVFQYLRVQKMFTHEKLYLCTLSIAAQICSNPNECLVCKEQIRGNQEFRQRFQATLFK